MKKIYLYVYIYIYKSKYIFFVSNVVIESRARSTLFAYVLVTVVQPSSTLVTLSFLSLSPVCFHFFSFSLFSSRILSFLLASTKTLGVISRIFFSLVAPLSPYICLMCSSEFTCAETR